MAFIVQDAEGDVANANSYISVAKFKSYHDDRGNSYSGFANDPAIEKALVKATDYLDARFNYIGSKPLQEQTTEWPRVNALDPTGFLVSGIPLAVQEACAEYALRVLDGSLFPDPQRDASGYAIESKSEQVGPISESVTYAHGGQKYLMPIYPIADNKLKRAGLVLSSNDLVRS